MYQVWQAFRNAFYFMKFIKLFFIMTFFISGVYAQKYDDFLNAVQENLPINTDFLKWVLKNHGTKLAAPSLLEQWGLINSENAAAFFPIFNALVVKPENLTLDGNTNRRRLKNWDELRKTNQNDWEIKMGTIFHELSHAEYDWLPSSKSEVDKELVHFLENDFKNYLKTHHPNYNYFDRNSAPSEMYAYFHGEFLYMLLYLVDDLFIENGYFKVLKKCKNDKKLEKILAQINQPSKKLFFTLGQDEDFTQISLPSIYVKGKEVIVDSTRQEMIRLRELLWKQFTEHAAPVRSKYEVVKWMNSNPNLLNLISSCRN